MIGSGNQNYNNQINRKSPQHQINDDMPNQKFYQNYYNRNVNTRQNIKINMNNINTNINNNSNNNIRNTNTDINNNIINKALMILRSELMVVVFPAPFRPMKPMILPDSTEKLMPSSLNPG